MAKPVLLTVDDDPEVLRAVERDLRRRYAEHYRVLRADSGATALEALRGLKRRGDSVALLLVDQRMPQMTGVEFLGQAMEIFPNAKRVLLRLRRHRRGDSRHQRRQHSSLLAETVGPSRGTPLPGAG
jgi:thioredoxin reductase (NADPH)